MFTKHVHDWAFTGWVLGIAAYIGVTCIIVIKLWWMGRKVDGVTSTLTWGSHGMNKYATIIFIIVESGSIYTATSLVYMVLYLTQNIVALTMLDITTQLAVCQGNVP